MNPEYIARERLCKPFVYAIISQYRILYWMNKLTVLLNNSKIASNLSYNSSVKNKLNFRVKVKSPLGWNTILTCTIMLHWDLFSSLISDRLSVEPFIIIILQTATKLIWEIEDDFRRFYIIAVPAALCTAELHLLQFAEVLQLVLEATGRRCESVT